MDTLGFAPGAMTPRIQTAICAWQFDRKPDEGTAEQCAEWLKETWNAGGIIPEEERAAPKGKASAKAAGAHQDTGDNAAKKKRKS